MLFTFKHKQYRYKNLTSGQVRKLLAALKYSVKDQKLIVRKAIKSFQEHAPHYHVDGIPHVTVVPGTSYNTKKGNNNETTE